MPLIMKSSDNGFVDATSKTVRFPGRERSLRELAQPAHDTISACAGGGWTASSWSNELDVVAIIEGEEPGIAPTDTRPTHTEYGTGTADWLVVTNEPVAPIVVSVEQFEYQPFELASVRAALSADVLGSAGSEKVAYFAELKCFRAEGMAACSAGALVPISYADLPAITYMETMRGGEEIVKEPRAMSARRRRAAA
jgi:hypothetical protein